jgi:Flp pilus assembly protein TadB
MLTSAAVAAGETAKVATKAVAARMPANERFIEFLLVVWVLNRTV